MQACAYDPDLVNHFTVVLYPFVHTVTGGNLGKRWQALEERWQPWWTRLNDDQTANNLEATNFFLPYVQRLLFPELCHLQSEPTGAKYQNWRRLLRRLTDRGLKAYVDSLPEEPVLRLTIAPEILARIAEFEVQQTVFFAGRNMGPGKTAARFEWVDALLFPSGLGFLMLKAKLNEEKPLFSQIIQLNRALHVVHPPCLSASLPTLRMRSTGAEMHLRDLFDFLTQGLVAEQSDVATGDVLAFERHVGYTDSEPGRAYGEHCFRLSYGCLNAMDDEFQHMPKGTFPDSESRLLFEFASNISLGESVDSPMWIPSPSQAEKYAKDYTLSLWRCWKAMGLKESLVFLASEDISFTRRSLPQLIESDYLPLYAYTLFQRFQLSVFTNDLMREVALVKEHLRGAKALLQRFVSFRNRYMFNDVTCKPQGTCLYRMLHHGLEVDTQYQLVTASVKEAKEYYQEQWDRQMELAVKGVGMIGGPSMALYGAVRYFLSEIGIVGLAVLLGGALLLTSSVLLLWMVFKPKKICKLPPPIEDEKLPDPPMETISLAFPKAA